ncbi:hypothetical protein Sjap_015550 [Stephania japonica]|uniref:Retrotransposon Copia-like N-terminal domain-containing protein n=1 Tax=Stephania japonica TaxID=461633 RepID=A0AAP0NRG8_9MAGN
MVTIPSQITGLNMMHSQLSGIPKLPYKYSGLNGIPSIPPVATQIPRMTHVDSIPSPIYHSSPISSPNLMRAQFFTMPLMSGGQAVTMTTPFGNSLTQSLSIKLELDNYLLWKSLLLPLFRGNGLDGIVLRAIPCPPLID